MATEKVFQQDIIKRFLDDKAFKSLQEDYEEAKWVRSHGRTVTTQDLNILRDYKTGGLMENELVKKYKISRSRIQTALRIAALSKI